MKFAIEMTMTRKEDGSSEFNEKKAKKMYDFICANVELVDSDVVPVNQMLSSVFEEIKDTIREVTKKKE